MQTEPGYVVVSYGLDQSGWVHSDGSEAGAVLRMALMQRMTKWKKNMGVTWSASF